MSARAEIREKADAYLTKPFAGAPKEEQREWLIGQLSKSMPVENDEPEDDEVS